MFGLKGESSIRAMIDQTSNQFKDALLIDCGVLLLIIKCNLQNLMNIHCYYLFPIMF